MALLVQIDKLVQLIESPVFTCEIPHIDLRVARLMAITMLRSEAPASRAREISVSVQVLIWPVDVVAPKFSIRLSEEQA